MKIGDSFVKIGREFRETRGEFRQYRRVFRENRREFRENQLNFREKRRSEIHTLPSGVNEILPVLSSLLSHLGDIRYKRPTYNAADSR